MQTVREKEDNQLTNDNLQGIGQHQEDPYQQFT